MDSLDRLERQGIRAILSAYIYLIQECSNRKDLRDAKSVYADIINRGFKMDVYFENRLIIMYDKCNSVIDARQVFEKMVRRNVVSWNAIIGCYARHGQCDEAFKLFEQMQQESLKPDRVTFLSILNAFASPETQAPGKLVHAHIISERFESDIALGNALVNMYGRCRSIDNARTMFDRMIHKDMLSWNTMISAYAQGKYTKEALKLFQEMQCEGIKADDISFITILNLCDSPEALALGKLLHAHIIDTGIEGDIVVGTAIVNMYGKCGGIEDACRLFRKMPEKNAFSWNIMIGGYTGVGRGEAAFKCFNEMQLQGVKPDKISFINILSACAGPEALSWGKLVHAHIVERGFNFDLVVGNALVTMYCKCGRIGDALKMFDKMQVRDVVSWTVMLDACARYGESKIAFKLFQQMQQEGIKPDKVAFIGILNACHSPEDLELGKIIHAGIIERGFHSDIVVGTALLNMYGKCGSLKDAQKVFDKMPERSVVSWNAMIAMYGQHGCSTEAFRILQQMQQEGMKPDAVTLVNVLNACSHAGLVDEGMHFFNSMSRDHGIMPTVEHHNCIVDLLGRAGRLNEAEDFINKMPVQPDAVTWMILLGSCRSHGCINRGEHAAERALQLDPHLSAVYVVLSNIYAMSGRWDDVTKVRKLMVDRAL